MHANGNSKKHWLLIASHFAVDSLLFLSCLILGLLIRFGSASDDVFWVDWIFYLLASLVYPCLVYIFGLYSSHSAGTGMFKRGLISLFCVVVSLAALVAATYMNTAHPLGRGVTLIGGAIAWAVSLLHQMVLLHVLRTSRERVVYIVTCAFDEAETRLFKSFGGSRLELVGLIEDKGYRVKGDCKVLGKACDLEEIVEREKIHKVLCTSRSLHDDKLCRQFCQLRYTGVAVVPLISLCEEVEQYVPLELVTSQRRASPVLY